MTPLAEDLAAGRGPRGEGWRMRGRVPLTIFRDSGGFARKAGRGTRRLRYVRIVEGRRAPARVGGFE